MYNAKKILVVSLLTTMTVFLFASYAAAAATVTGSGEIRCGTDGSGNDILIGLSSGVNASYTEQGGDATSAAASQWYAAATVHQGGNKGYATAQDLNNILSVLYETGSDMAVILDAVPTDATSVSGWPAAGGNNWALQ